MGIIRVLKDAIGGGLADTWLEVIESTDMDPETVVAPGVAVRPDDPRNSNTKKTANTVSNGSIIHINEGQCMLLIDGGKIVDYSAEAGYYKVDDSSLPSLMNGELKESVKESFNRVRFAGSTPQQQRVYFINLQEIRGCKFGTPNPVNYFDNFYNAELFLRAFGTYSIRIVDPVKFYIQVADHTSKESIRINDINEQYRDEFLTAFQSSLNKMSLDGLRISHVLSRSMELAKYMQDVLDEKWTDLRGFRVESVGIGSISYTEDSQEMINMRNKGSMLSDASIREGYVQGSIARGMEAAGSNEAGAGQTFMGMGIGMNAAGAGMGQFSQTNAQQMKAQEEKKQSEEAQRKQDEQPTSSKNSWTCPECGTMNEGNFCSECGTKRPIKESINCPKCGTEIDNPKAKFCPECGAKLKGEENDGKEVQ